MLPHFSLACTGLKLDSLIQASRQMHVRVSLIVQRCKIKNLEAKGAYTSYKNTLNMVREKHFSANKFMYSDLHAKNLNFEGYNAPTVTT